MVLNGYPAAAPYRPKVGRGLGGLAEEVELHLEVGRIDQQALDGQPRLEGKVLTAPDEQRAMGQRAFCLLRLPEGLCHEGWLPCRRERRFRTLV